jgi:hypothetical protein
MQPEDTSHLEVVPNEDTSSDVSYDEVIAEALAALDFEEGLFCKQVHELRYMDIPSIYE